MISPLLAARLAGPANAEEVADGHTWLVRIDRSGAEPPARVAEILRWTDARGSHLGVELPDGSRIVDTSYSLTRTAAEKAATDAEDTRRARRKARVTELRELLPAYKAAAATAAQRDRGLFLIGKLVLADDDE